AELEERLRLAGSVKDDDLAAALFFVNRIARNPDFDAESVRRVTSPEISRELEDFAKDENVFGPNVTIDISGAPFKLLPRFKFIYGDFTVKDKDGVVIYSDKIGRGVITLLWDSQGRIKHRVFPVPSVVVSPARSPHGKTLRSFVKNLVSAA